MNVKSAIKSSTRGDQRGGSQINWKSTKMRISLHVLSQLFFKICLYTRHFDSSVCSHALFSWHFANSSKLLKNNFFNELDLTSFKFSAIKWFFKSLEKLAKCHKLHVDKLMNQNV